MMADDALRLPVVGVDPTAEPYVSGRLFVEYSAPLLSADHPVTGRANAERCRLTRAGVNSVQTW